MEVPGKIIEPNEERRNSEGEDTECEPCKGEGITTPANGYCRDCGEYMCNTCFRHHLKGKLCRHHVLVDIDLSSTPFPERKEAVVHCKQHNGETIRFYCRKHEVVGCGDCMLFEHNACNSEYIKTLSDKFRQGEEFNKLIRKIENITAVIKDNEDKLKENEKENNLMLEKTLGDIRKFRVEFNKYLDKVEADVISEAKRIKSDNDELLTKLEQDCKQISSKITKMKQLLNTDIYTDNVIFINAVEYKPEVFDIEEAVTQMQSHNMKKFEFVRDEELRSIITSTQKFGTLAISSATSHHKTIESTQKKSEKTRYADNTDEKEKAEVTQMQSHNMKTFARDEQLSSIISSTQRVENVAISSATSHHQTMELSENKSEKTRYAGNTNKKEEDVKSAAVATVGARVRRNFGLGRTGTVTTVHTDGTVDVKFDIGNTWTGCTVGAGYYDVSLI